DLRDVGRTAGAEREDARADGRTQGNRRDRDHVTVVGADLERDRSVLGEQRDAVERSGLADALDLRTQLVDLGLNSRTVIRAERAVLVLNGQVSNTLKHRVNLVHLALGRLDERNAVLGVAVGLSKTTDLSTQLLANGEASSVVSGGVDPVTG